MNFVNLHCHSNYSFLDGLSRISDMVNRAKELDQNALALTDHGVMCGSISFYKACRAAGIKPILGVEAYFTRDLTLKSKKSSDVNTHLILLAKDNIGYANLIKIVSESFIGDNRYYHRPRVDTDLLDSRRSGIIATSACLSSPFRRALMPRDTFDLDSPWMDACERLMEIFGDNFFFETQTYEAKDQKDYNEKIRKIAKERKRPVIVTSDCHYVFDRDFDTHDLLLAIQSAKDIDDPTRLRHECNTLYLHSAQEIYNLGFPEEEITNTQYIADLCNVELDFSIKFPKVKNAMKRIRNICKSETDNKYKERMEYELNTIESSGFADYLLIIADAVSWAKESGIRVGPGRGSAGGSLVCYRLGITEVDPIKHELLFERFIDPNRIALPDIDLDFQDDRRAEVVNYIKDRYGNENVAHIATMHTLGIKQAFKDVCRTVGVPFDLTNEITKGIDDESSTLDEAIKKSPELKQQISRLDKRIIEFTDKLVGNPRQASMHAAGIVIAPTNITDYVPLMKSNADIVTQFDMRDIEQIGLVKMDFLGLKTLTIIENAIRLIALGDKHKREFVENSIRDLSDTEVYKMLSEGKTKGCFQVETPGITNLCKQFNIKEFEDIVQIISVFRPAVLHTSMFPQYMKNRYNPDSIAYLHPDLRQHLGKTYGVLLFQEQLMMMSRAIAGFSASEADKLRKGIAKKIPELIVSMENKFIEGAIKNGYSKNEANLFFSILEDGGYGFNRSHAVEYAMITYQTAWLKYYYPVEYMVAVLNSETEPEDIQEYLSECHRLKIPINNVNINKSSWDHVVEKNIHGYGIRLGYKVVKNVGQPMGEQITQERKQNGDYESIEDFLYRNAVELINTRCIEYLAIGGAFEELGYNRKEILEKDENGDLVIIKAFQKIKKSNRLNKEGLGQISLFSADEIPKMTIEITRQTPPDSETMLFLDREAFGLYVQNPLLEMESSIRDNTITTNEELKKKKTSEYCRIVGIIHEIAYFETNRGTIAKMKIMTLDDTISGIIFSNRIDSNRQYIHEGAVVIISGKPNFYQNNISFSINSMRPANKEVIEL